MESLFSLKGKTFLVTGSSSGIGRQIAIHFSKMGATVMLSGRNEDRLKETMTQLQGEGHRYFPLDINDGIAMERTVDMIPDCHGLVQAAGILKINPIKVVSEEEIYETLRTNFISPLALIRLLLNKHKIKNGGSVVFISSINGVFANTKGFGVYASSKAALNSMVKTLALEYAPKRIRFNAVNPAMIKTDMYTNMLTLLSEKDIQEDKKKYPLGDYGEPEDVANACIFLASDASKWITGTSLVVDGGLTIN